jgi:biotin transport system substrate-specific component
MKTKQLVLVGMFTAILAIISPLQIIIPISPVPITLQILGVTLAATILGAKLGTLSVIIYTLLGAIGVPVFAGYTSGIPKLIGPTGGYIIGFIIAAYIMGTIVEKQENNTILNLFIVNSIGLIIVYAIGTLQLSFVYTHSIEKAFIAGVLPYILPDIVKLIFCAVLTVQIKNVFKKTGYAVL